MAKMIPDSREAEPKSQAMMKRGKQKLLPHFHCILFGRGDTEMKDHRTEPQVITALPACPNCGSVLYDAVYKDCSGVIGCDECLWRIPAEEWLDELEEKREEERYEWEEDW
ncbi:MAG: hypothetical protein J6M64_00580 [Oscillospiraceae bacterium]|nr:hypothetical protein [Oscillospiraceae bacterium]